MVRPTYAVIDLAAVRHNVRAIGELIAPSQVCAVVKADGYGHGDAPVAAAALDAGASRLAVALVEEGVRLREAGIGAPILVLSQPAVADAAEFQRWDLTPSVYDPEFAGALGVSGFRGTVHIKVDTGMHRVGVSPDRLGSLMEVVRSLPFEIEGVFTHFPVADSDKAFTQAQISAFDALVDFEVPYVHMANTPGAVLFTEARRDFCRIGLGLYGLHPCDETKDLIDLRPSMSIVTHISHMQRLPRAARPSYGRRRPLPAESNVATIPIGYADGFWRQLSKNGRALVNGDAFPLAGTITMDQTMIDLGNSTAEIGDEVVLIGRQGDQSITADDWAHELGTISYEVVCSIGPRVPRRYQT